MAKESKYPNLPEKKTCPVCKKEFPRPLKSGKPLSDRQWYTKKYCSQKCVTDNRRKSNDSLFR